MGGHWADVGVAGVGDGDVGLDEFGYLHDAVDAGSGAVYPLEVVGGEEDFAGWPSAVGVGIFDGD